MRSLDNVFRAGVGFSLIAALAACAGGRAYGELDAGGPLASAGEADRFGPAADYPVVVGEPFTVEGVTYTPSDELDYDEVGYAGVDPDAAGVTASSKVLPLPSYVEVTSLESGKTVLVRVERRGPMTSRRMLSLSPMAQAQLGVADGGAVRVRRVNPPEYERAPLRRGEAGVTRLDTPESLLAVLRKRLPQQGAASLLATSEPTATPPAARPSEDARFAAAFGQPETRTAATAVEKRPVPSGQRAPSGASYPLPPLIAQPIGADVQRGDTASMQAARRRIAMQARPTPSQPTNGRFTVQAGAFSSAAAARRVADSIDGFVESQSGLYRVRTGPYATRGQAQAALAKVRAAGYSDARVYTEG